MIKVTKYEHVKSEDIRQRSKVKDVVREIYKKKLMWAGHIARLRDNRWTKRALDWLPRGIKRKRGRPPIRWEDPIRKVFGKFGREWLKTDKDGAVEIFVRGGNKTNEKRIIKSNQTVVNI